MNKRVDDALKFLDDLLLLQKETIDKFKTGGQLVTFEMVHAIGTDPIDIAAGVSVWSTEKTNQEVDLSCKMQDKAELPNHMHPDADEDFDIEYGKLFDKNTNTVHEGKFTFKAGQWHNLVAIGETFIKIKSRKIES